jgi:hypothetical protein
MDSPPKFNPANAEKQFESDQGSPARLSKGSSRQKSHKSFAGALT